VFARVWRKAGQCKAFRLGNGHSADLALTKFAR
jgi:hypothetical protein